jgi:MFS family permease
MPEPPPPAEETRRRPLAEHLGLSGFNFLTMVRRGFFYTFLMVYLRERLEQPATYVALVGTTLAATGTAGQLLVWGRWLDRTGRTAALMVRGELWGGVGYLAVFGVYRLTLDAVSPAMTTLVLIACLGALELVWSATDVGYRAAVAQVAPAGRRGRFLGVLDLVGLTGMGAGLLLAGLLYRGGDGFEDGSLWLLAAGFILAGVPLLRATLGHLDRVGGPERPVAPRPGPLAPGYRRYMFVLGVAVVGLWSFHHNHTYFIRLPSAAGASDHELSLVRTAFWVVSGVSAPVAGTLIDRIGSRRAYVWALGLGALVPLTFLPTTSVAYAAATLGLYGAFLGALRSASYTLAIELAPEEGRGRHFALYNAVMATGWGAASLLVGGPVADLVVAAGDSVHAGYTWSFVAGSALGLAGLGLFFWLAPRSAPPG